MPGQLPAAQCSEWGVGGTGRYRGRGETGGVGVTRERGIWGAQREGEKRLWGQMEREQQRQHGMRARHNLTGRTDGVKYDSFFLPCVAWRRVPLALFHSKNRQSIQRSLGVYQFLVPSKDTPERAGPLLAGRSQ